MSSLSVFGRTGRPDPSLGTAARESDQRDRTYLDDQVRDMQIVLAALMVNGVVGTIVPIDGSGPDIAKGDVLCRAQAATLFATLASTANLTAAGSPLGVAVAACPRGSRCLVALGGILPPDITGLASSDAGPVRVSSVGRLEKVANIGAGDSYVGDVDAYGYLTLNKQPGTVGSATGAEYRYVFFSGLVQNTGESPTTLGVRRVDPADRPGAAVATLRAAFLLEQSGGPAIVELIPLDQAEEEDPDILAELEIEDIGEFGEPQTVVTGIIGQPAQDVLARLRTSAPVVEEAALWALINELWDDFKAHVVLTTGDVHGAPDTTVDTYLDDEIYPAATDLATGIARQTALNVAYGDHLGHDTPIHLMPDTTHPLTDPSAPATVYQLRLQAIDMKGKLNLHLVDETVHGSADATNTITGAEPSLTYSSATATYVEMTLR